MTAFGRLWRRAPAWRFLLILALASTALAAMFPPPAPSLNGLWPARRHAVLDPRPRYAPPPDAAPLDYSVIDLPPITATRSLLIPFAGRQVPLPQGGWTELALMRAGGPQALQAIVLARLRGGRLTGMMIVAGPSATAPQASALRADGCFDVKGLATHEQSASAGPDAAAQQCWNLRPLVTAQLADPANPNLLEQRSFARLGKIGIEVPVRLLAMRYFTEDAAGGLTVTIMEPDPVASAATQRRSEAWMQRWVALLHRGFAGTLRPADVTAALARDPGAADATRAP